MEDIKHKFTPFIQNSHWSEEDQQWMKQYLDGDDTSELQQFMQHQFADDLADNILPGNESGKELLNRIHAKIKGLNRQAVITRLPVWKKAFAAASIVLVLATAGWLVIKQNRTVTPQNISSNQQANEIVPGGNKAMLILADQTTIVLDMAENGTLAKQANTEIIKSKDGQLQYSDAGNAGETVYNTLSTPRGGQYQLVLPDGSKVWLNSASSLRFPVNFNGLDRKVELQGEAYFEIAKNAAKPFRVTIAGRGEVEVLGTCFNVNAYSDEPGVNTTLLEGSVKITSLQIKKSQKIKPGQQAQLSATGQISIQYNVDTDEVMAWKNGLFNFNNASMVKIMGQIRRWYDVDIELDQSVKTSKEVYSGIVNRNSNISEVLKVMESGGLKFKIEERKVFINQ